MEIRESKEGDVVMLSLEGSVRGSEETNALETSLASTLKAGARLLVVDCAGAGQLTSGAVRVLLSTSRRLDRAGGRLVLCGVAGKLKKAFSVSGVDKDFIVVPTREEGLQRVLEPVPLRTPKAKTSPPRVEAKEETPPARAEGGSSTVAADVPAAVAPPASIVQTRTPAKARTPSAPERRDALATVLLDTLGVRIVRPKAALSSRAVRVDLDALADNVLAALRVGRH
jgi:anti-anti-sigma factor